MKTRILWSICCIAALLAFSGCRSAGPEEAPIKREVKKETASRNASPNAASGNEQPHRVESTPGAGVGSQTEIQTDDPAEAAQEGTAPGQGAVQESGQAADEGTAGGESVQQCPYCGQWFSTEPDGDLWNPYDRHVLEERDSQQSEEQIYEDPDGAESTQAEMVQCPDCGNWYEEGNIFRNHICEGR